MHLSAFISGNMILWFLGLLEFSVVLKDLDIISAADIAFRKPARQQSVCRGRAANIAVSGLTLEQCAEGQYSRTHKHYYPWFRVNLGGMHTVTRIVITPKPPGKKLNQILR